ncbi:hypothetical protein SNEBB_000474 [Seison nebaliae]|nr:hypothetical protein SNEBB_000474 [Seison nebaliae]
MNSSFRCLLVDVGGYTIKIGWSDEKKPKIYPNCIYRSRTSKKNQYISGEIKNSVDRMSLYYHLPIQKGYITNWELQKEIFDYIFDDMKIFEEEEHPHLLITEPLFNFHTNQVTLISLLFNHYQFGSIRRFHPIVLGYYYSLKKCKEDSLAAIVVDSGYSFTHMAAVDDDGNVIKSTIRRIDVGGKMLTNYMKEAISYRQLMVMEETFAINELKEHCSYVAEEDFKKELEDIKKNDKQIRYLLPDWDRVRNGRIIGPEESVNEEIQILTLRNIHMKVPELLFNPQQADIKQLGIVDCLIESILHNHDIDEQLKERLFGNIILFGGNMKIKKMKNRIEKDLRSHLNEFWEIKLNMFDELLPWNGALTFISHLNDTKRSNIAKKFDNVVYLEEFEKYSSTQLFQQFRRNNYIIDSTPSSSLPPPPSSSSSSFTT